MQIFLPYASFGRSLRSLDNKRLGKQRVEAYQIWLAVSGNTAKSSWINHPLCRMWKDYPVALRKYLIKSCKVWGERKTKDGKRFFDNTAMNENIKRFNLEIKPDEKVVYPPFFGKEEFHDSHKAMLFHKGAQEEKLATLAGKDEANYYKDWVEFSHIKEYFWPVPLLTKKNTLNADYPSIPLSAKRKKLLEQLKAQSGKQPAKKKTTRKSKAKKESDNEMDTSADESSNVKPAKSKAVKKEIDEEPNLKPSKVKKAQEKLDADDEDQLIRPKKEKSEKTSTPSKSPRKSRTPKKETTETSKKASTSKSPRRAQAKKVTEVKEEDSSSSSKASPPPKALSSRRRKLAESFSEVEQADSSPSKKIKTEIPVEPLLAPADIDNIMKDMDVLAAAENNTAVDELVTKKSLPRAVANNTATSRRLETEPVD